MSESFLPYARQSVSEQDVQAVGEVLRGDWLTTGPMVGQFESEFAKTVGADEVTHAVLLGHRREGVRLGLERLERRYRHSRRAE